MPLDDAGTSHNSYTCYDSFFECSRMCFNREVGVDSMTDSDELLVTCGRECAAQERLTPEASAEYFNYWKRDFLACLAGQPRPTLHPNASDGEFIEGEAADDAGVAPNCLAECLPSWR